MLPEHVIQLLQTQSGVVARHQIRELEPDRHARRSIYADVHLELTTRRVFRHRAVPPSQDQTLMTSILDAGPGAILWGKSAATRWGFGRNRLLPPHVAVPRRRRSSAGAHGQTHILTTLLERDCTHVAGIPIARPELVVLWMAGAFTHRFGHEIALERTEVALDQAWRQRLVDGRYIHELADRSGGRGRSGIIVLRQALERRPPDYQPAGSRLEERFESIVGAQIAGRLDRQATVDITPVIRTVDFLHRDRPLIVEINGEAFHSSLTDRAADDERYQRLLALGFSVVVFWEHDVWNDAESIRRSMERLASQPDPRPMLHRPTKAPWEC